MERVLVLSANKYKFTEDETGREIEGLSVYYVPDEVPASDHIRRGLSVLKMSTSRLELWEAAAVLPGVYELDIQMRPGKNLRPTPTLTGLRYVKSANIAGLIQDDGAAKGQGRVSGGHSNTA